MSNERFKHQLNSILASEKREAMEKKLRIKLEDELKELRAQQQGEEQGAQRRFPGGSDTLEELRRKFAEAEEKVRAFDLSINVANVKYKRMAQSHIQFFRSKSKVLKLF